MVHGFSALSLDQFRLLVAGLALMGMAYFVDPKSLVRLGKDKQSLIMIFVLPYLAFFLINMPIWRLFMRQMQEQQTVLQYLCPVGILAYTCIKDKVAPTVS